MKWKMKVFAVVLCLAFSAGSLTGCNAGAGGADGTGQGAGENTVTISGAGIEAVKVDLGEFQEEARTYIYSVINNWPSKKFYTAEGVDLQTVLESVNADGYESITVRGADGYESSFTKEQLTEPRYYYPNLEMDSESKAEQVPFLLSVRFAEDSVSEADMTEAKPTLLFGQANVFEHNSPAFVEDISEIILSDKDPGCWEAPTVFPEAGAVAPGETVKLQHPSAGLVKIFYTLDGSEPTECSNLYNPSTYQPELNVPITVTENVTIKAFAVGYGKHPSEVAEFHFHVVN
ncbi:MAG: chitobiase/beta-hexosaminidase C-terminal domain-containing protein [Firmicutes bacterium]|nr:chitobiase/beta-hexosaminidase C-terminal domain-containing protein [Bacillota bacterium]